MRLPVILTLCAAAAGCAAPRADADRELVRGYDARRPTARAEIADGEAAPFLERAARVLRAEGLRIAARTPTQIVTAPRETEAVCGRIPCRTRELAMVHVSGQVVRLEILRAVRALHGGRWELAVDPVSASDTMHREGRILQQMLGDPRARVELSLR